jgi:hypothetical protein
MQIELDRDPYRITHSTAFAHWCHYCWDWIIDCEHLIDPLPMRAQPATDAWVRSLAYDARQGILQVAFTWQEVRQFRPVPPATFRRLSSSNPMRDFLYRHITSNRRMRTARVRTDQTLAFVLAMAAEMLWSRRTDR